MSGGVLFIIGLLAVWVLAVFIARWVVRGDYFNDEGNLELRVEHLESRLSVHRTWWKTMVVVITLVFYVTIVGIFSIQNLAKENEREVRERAAIVEENRRQNSCAFRGFVEQFFVELYQGQFNAETVQYLDGYEDLDPAARRFVDSLAQSLERQSEITLDARQRYVEEFPTTNC